LIVQFEETTPGMGCVVTFSDTQPFHLVELARSNAEVVFVGSVQVLDCE
jgi:hypothetical protein